MSTFSNTAKSDLHNTKDKIHAASADVAKEFKTFIGDVENLIKDTTSLTGEDLAKAKAKLAQRISSAKESVNEMSGVVIAQARKTATATDDYVHERPWVAIGAGAALSFAAGFLLASRESR